MFLNAMLFCCTYSITIKIITVKFIYFFVPATHDMSGFIWSHLKVIDEVDMITSGNPEDAI